MDESQALRVRLNAETGRIGWDELAPHFARGVVVQVASDLDLVEVAACFVENRHQQVEQWMASSEIARASDDDAARWAEQATDFWAVVVAPWVLVQENVRGET